MTDHREVALNALAAVQALNDNLPELHHHLHVLKDRGLPNETDLASRRINAAVAQLKHGLAVANAHALLAIEDRLADLVDVVERSRDLNDRKLAELLNDRESVPVERRF